MTPTELDDANDEDAAWRAGKITEAERLLIKAEWRAACRTRRDARKSALRATDPNEPTNIEQSQRADYNAAQGYVARGCCCTTNHTQVITDYQSQDHTS